MEQAMCKAADRLVTLMRSLRRLSAAAVNERMRLSAFGLTLGVLATVAGDHMPVYVFPGAATDFIEQGFANADERIWALSGHSAGGESYGRARPNRVPDIRYVVAARLAPANSETQAAGVISALLTIPAGWQPGDAAAVVVAEQPWAEGWRTRLLEELLAEGTAVLDLDVHAEHGATADSGDAPPALASYDLLPDLYGALRSLAGQEIRAGAVLAFGRGVGGEAALLAAQEPIAVQYLGRNGLRFTAAARLDAGCEWSTNRREAPLDWRADALNTGMALAVAGGLASEDLQVGDAEAVSLACVAALVAPAESRPRLQP